MPQIDNAFYDELGERWYEDSAHPIALLRAESTIKLDFVRQSLLAQPKKPTKLLDIGCGAGLLSIPLAGDGYEVKGIDLSENSIATARARGSNAKFAVGSAYELPEADGSYDAVLMMDFLEHVEEPERAISEARRVLRPGGILLTQTFNRTWRARLLAIHAVRLLARGCPPHFHVYDLFIKPQELVGMAADQGLHVEEMKGLRPEFFSKAFWWSVTRRRLHPNFSFRYTRSLGVGYLARFTKLAA